MQKTPHYRDLIKRELSRRIRRNPVYSLRAFARDLGVPCSKLSEVLRGRRNFSRKTAERVADVLRFPSSEREHFLDLVDFHQTRNRLAQDGARTRLATRQALDGYGELSLERFKIIADWHHFAILELTEIEPFESDSAWIAGRLAIPIAVAREATERLLDFGLLVRAPEGKLHQTHQNLATPSGIPSRELREHHSQILMKADSALELVPIAERDFSAVTLAFDPAQMEVVRAELKRFRRRLGDRIQQSSPKTRVYCLSTQFFPLDHEPSSPKENPK
jgi:uncharacterized protein (TIGR02147 family)